MNFKKTDITSFSAVAIATLGVLSKSQAQAVSLTLSTLQLQ